MPETQHGCGAVGVEDVPEGEVVIPLQDADVVVSGMKDLQNTRTAQNLPKESEIEMVRQRIDQPGLLSRLDLEKTELVPKKTEGVVFRVEGDDRL
jgi:hypothetical protein